MLVKKITEYRELFEQHLSAFIEKMGEKNTLRDACSYALLNQGKRLRPILVLLIADSLKLSKEVMSSALSVEFFHTASLIADDLPSMDDDEKRRDRPSLHKAFGEDVAILTSYALIAEGYGLIAQNSLERPELATICIQAATRCAGIQGATNGQFLDLYPPSNDLDMIKKIIYQKTITLFEISFLFGWLFGGGAKSRIDEVKTCAYHLGMAFQIADDLLDVDQDEKSEINIAHACGWAKARDLFQEEVELFQKALKGLGIFNQSFQEVVWWLENYAKGASEKMLPNVGSSNL